MLNQGQILEGKYEVIRILGQGGMGTVYLCKNNRLGNLWAVKEVNSEWKNKVDLLAEPNILKNLNHIGIVRIIDIFYEHDNLYIVEDYIKGKNLKEYVDADGPLSSELVIDMSFQLCSILDYLHSLNPPIIYRDLKPSNIMITPSNKVVLIDFGIARVYKEGQEGDTMVLGSKGYIAPEQLMNNQSNAKTDIYSLGVTMFFMLTGKTISLNADAMCKENYPTHAAEGLVKVIQKALTVNAEIRYSNVKLIMSELSTIMSDKECNKTKLMNSNKSYAKDDKTVLVQNKKHSKRVKLTIIAVLACIIILSIFLISIISKKESDKKDFEAPAVHKTSVKTESKQLNKAYEKSGEEQKNQEQNSSDKLKSQKQNSNEQLKNQEEQREELNNVEEKRGQGLKKSEEKQNKKQKKSKKSQKS
ncbi:MULTISPECIES: serine/threonine-protein kinase [Clostridium]|uniref:serine/threonine-protein kinase n=1 Tax=Clostridium TaxID=1485 RepID=UPI00069FFFA5|nr:MULTISPECIES: serine/threonine-protein kinase [Clostridium]MCD2347848.1 serine/threonine protein kinase [Clostridium guangxiense]